MRLFSNTMGVVMKRTSFSIKYIAPIYTSIPVIFLGITLSYIWNVQSRTSVEQISEDYINQIHSLVQNKVEEIVSMPIQLSSINQALIEEGYLNLNQLDGWKNTFKEEFKTYKWISSIVWGDSYGRALWIGRYSDGNVYWAIKEDPKSSLMMEWQLDEEGNRIVDSENSFAYDLYSRPWFTTPMDAGESKWTKPFIWAGGEDTASVTVGISYGIPLYDDQDAFLGVIDADLSLNDLSAYLQTIQIGKTGIALIVSNDGTIIASSGEVNNVNEDGTIATLASLNLLEASQVNTFLSTANSVDSDHLKSGKIELPNENQFITTSVVGAEAGLSWQLITLVPEEDFLSEIDSSYFNSTLISIFAGLFAVILGFIASNWLIKPLLTLTEFTRSISRDSLNKSIQLQHTYEYEALANSVNLMIQNLSESRDHEVLLNRELDHRVKNMLAQIVSICRQSVGKATSDKVLLEDLTSRVAGIASIHELLASNKNTPAQLQDLVMTCLKPYAGLNIDDVVSCDGVDVSLNSKSVLCVGMVLNELANNSFKYGSLLNGDGHISIEWILEEIDGLSCLNITWTEQHENKIPESISGGLGSKIVRLAIPHELEGQSDISIEGNTIQFVASIPVESIR